MKSILAGIVLYNPDTTRLKMNIDSINEQVDRIILINNNSENMKDIKELLDSYKEIEIIENEKNEGIAYALNEILDYANKNGFEWFLTLDQDSVAQENLVKEYSNFFEIDDVAMMTCKIVDRNFETEKNIDGDFEYIEKCITSGTINNTKILKELRWL